MFVQRELDREGNIWATFRFDAGNFGYFDHYGTFWDFFCTQPFTMVIVMAYLSRKYHFIVHYDHVHDMRM